MYAMSFHVTGVQLAGGISKSTIGRALYGNSWIVRFRFRAFGLKEVPTGA